MRKQSIKCLVLNRRLGWLKTGRHRDEVERRFGEPVDHVVSNPSVVTYKNVEVRYERGVVESFKIYLTREGAFPLADFLELSEVTVTNVREWLTEATLDALPEPRLSEYDVLVLAVSNAVTLVFHDGRLVAIDIEGKQGANFSYLQEERDG